jgi:hypothetical protein
MEHQELVTEGQVFQQQVPTALESRHGEAKEQNQPVRSRQQIKLATWLVLSPGGFVAHSLQISNDIAPHSRLATRQNSCAILPTLFIDGSLLLAT